LQESIFNEEQSKFDVATGSFAVALGMVGPTLMAHGTAEQQQEFLPAMLSGRHIWCQLFSEPGAGSDLAALGTRAVLDGDTWVVNGQKVWTSMGQFSDFAILLARTEPDSPKHKGITYFILDMRTPGIEVRPLTQITGVAHFNEVFLSDVRIPKENVLGQVHGGWAVANTTLTSERAFIRWWRKFVECPRVDHSRASGGYARTTQSFVKNLRPHTHEHKHSLISAIDCALHPHAA